MIVFESIAELYSDLCIKLRDLDRHDESGKAICVWCKEQKGRHLGDMRCSAAACSQYFTAVHNETKQKIVRALELIEELKEIDI